MSVFFTSAYWSLESQWWVVQEHRPIFKTCAAAGSTTARLVTIWAPVLCFPQWIAPLVFQGTPESWAIFFARYMAMNIVRVLDGKIPFTRALGLCHLLTLGPAYLWLSYGNNNLASVNEGSFEHMFWAAELKIIGLCLFLDTRDLIFHLLGQPFPSYIRVAVQAGAFKEIKDKRAQAKVTWWSVLAGP